MNAFTAIVPDPDADPAADFDVKVYLAPEGDLWIAESDGLPLATEAPTLDALIERVWAVAPEIAELNGHRGKLGLRFLLHTVSTG
jgi:hypothetical protein